jgi:hypothetical protein
MSMPSEIANKYVPSHEARDGSSAAKRRKNAAHSASCGWLAKTMSAPEVRKSTRRFSRAAQLLVSSMIFFFAGFPARAQSPNALLPPGEAKERAEAACLTCHEARIIVQQRLSKAAWTKELDKMIKWGAEVDPKDRDALIDYFSANFGPDQRVYAAPKSQALSGAKSKSKH